MHDIISSYKSYLEQAITALKEELKSIRTGRAHPGMIESIQVETYGGSTKMKLMEMASIMTDGATTLIVTLYDPATAPDAEKAIMASPLGINPQREGGKIIIRIPPLSEEQRIKFTRFVSQMIEDTKNKIRMQRDEARKKIKRLQDEKTISEDERYRGEKEIDTLTTQSGETLTTIKTAKEKEIMQV